MNSIKRILITGSSRGIGAHCASYIAKHNKDIEIVLHCNKNKEMAQEIKTALEQYGTKASILQFDISDRNTVFKILEDDIKNNGAYYAIVLNAGIARDNVFFVMEENEWDDVINTNLGGFYNVLKPAVKAMIEHRIKGRIVTMSSISGLAGNRGQVNYSASKAGIIGAVKALSRETAKRNITVNCVAPGVIESDMTADLPMEMIKEMVPMKRKGSVKEVASAINYLLSEDASYITGQVISVNGGMYL